jgi:hypothetical protein
MSALSEFCFVVAGIVLAIAASPRICRVRAQAQPEPPAFELRADYLQRAGLHFPFNMPSVLDVMGYQVMVPAHQELKIAWGLISGVEKSVPKERVTEGPLAPDFSLLERKQNAPGSAQTSTLTLSEMSFVIAAVTSKGEIRGLTVGLLSILPNAWSGGN